MAHGKPSVIYLVQFAWKRNRKNKLIAKLIPVPKVENLQRQTTLFCDEGKCKFVLHFLMIEKVRFPFYWTTLKFPHILTLISSLVSGKSVSFFTGVGDSVCLLLVPSLLPVVAHGAHPYASMRVTKTTRGGWESQCWSHVSSHCQWGNHIIQVTFLCFDILFTDFYFTKITRLNFASPQ